MNKYITRLFLVLVLVSLMLKFFGGTSLARNKAERIKRFTTEKPGFIDAGYKLGESVFIRIFKESSELEL